MLDALVSLRRQDQLETASGNGRRIIAELCLSLARAKRVTAACCAKNPLGVEQNIRNLTNLALARSIWSQNSAGAEPSYRRQPSRGKSTIRNGAAARGVARAGRPLGTQYGREGHNPRGCRGAP